jgi:hypothetical protein
MKVLGNNCRASGDEAVLQGNVKLKEEDYLIRSNERPVF